MTTFCLLEANCSVYDSKAKIAGICFTKPICDGCHSRTRTQLNLLRYDYVDLTQLLPKQGAIAGPRISRPKPESCLPLNLHILTLRDEIVYVVRLIEDAVRTSTRERLPTRDGWALDSGIRYLQPRIDDIARLPPTREAWSPCDPVTEALSGRELLPLIGSLHFRARVATGLEVRTEKIPGFCPYCSLPVLCRREDVVTCSACKRVVDLAEYLASVHLELGA